MPFNTKVLNYFKNRNRGLILSLLFLICLIYMPYLNNALFFDDLPFFSNSVSYYAELPFNFNLRWFSYTSLAWTWKLFSDTPLPLHFGNMLIHFANSVLLFAILRQLISLSIDSEISAQNQPVLIPLFANTGLSKTIVWGTWLGALCFACHPVAVYAVGYVVQRSTLMATFFTLAMQLVYLRGILNTHKVQQYTYLVLAVIFYFLAVFSKEHSLMAPSLLVAITLLLKPRIQANWHALVISWLGFIIIAILITLKAKGVFGVAYEHDAAALFEQQAIINTSENLHLLSIFTQAGLFFKYLFLWIIPNPAWMSIDMRETFASSVGDWQNWLKIACFFGYGLFALKLLLRRGKSGLIGFALLYPWLLFTIEFSSVRVQEPFVLYRSYLWMPGLMLLIPIVTSLAIQALPNKRTIIVAFTIAALALIPLSWNRLWVFADEYRLWNDAVVLLKNDFVPGAARIFYNRGLAEIKAKKFEAAIVDFKRVLAIDSKIEQAHANLGNAYLNTKQFKLALDSINNAIEINPKNGQTYFEKALALKQLDKKTEALDALSKGCELKNISACLFITMSQSMLKN